MSIPSTRPPALRAEHMTVHAAHHRHDVPITEDVTIEVMPGEAVAVVGESGSGKSVTARALLGLLPAGLKATGSVRIGDEDLAAFSAKRLRSLRGREIAVVLQDPFTMLNPLQRCGDIVTAALRTKSRKPLPKKELRAEAVRRLAEVGIADPNVAQRYPFELSGGMRQRVAIAAAIAENPRVLVADEPTTALDVTTQAEILRLLARLRETHDLALILITHDLRVAASVCDRAYVMYAGSVLEELPAAELLAGGRHPYTAKLTAADPPVDHRVARLPSIPGSVPAPGHRPTGCRFAPRCPWASAECTASAPPLTHIGPGRRVRCVRADDDLELVVPAPVIADDPPTPGGVPLVTMRSARQVFGRKVAVAGADLEVFAGESVGIVGESGSGKTSLARMMVGLDRPTAGVVEVGGIDLGASSLSRADWNRVRGTVQMAFQDPSSTLNPFRTVGSTLREALRLGSGEDLARRTAELLELVGLDAGYDLRRPRQLSGGERQRVAIARALARSPRLVVCDEVVSALDVSVQAHILNLLNELRDRLGIAYVFITHDLAVVRQVTSRIYVVKDGEIVESGPTGDVLSRPRHPYTRSLIESIPAPHGATSLPALPAEGA